MARRVSPEGRIVQEFLSADGAFVSGAILAQRLETSRVSVWSHMEKLRAQGYHFEARPRKGYRLRAAPARLSPVYLEATLALAGLELPLFFHEEIDSTNSEADRLIAGGEPPPFLVVAGAQSQGRGRLGREWFSRDSGSLYLTFAFSPGLPPARMQTFTLWMGVELCAFLQQHAPEVRLKWPNDLVAGGRKLGGILTEARVDADRIRDLVFGLGLNVNSDLSSWPEAVRATATSVASISGSKIPLNEFAARLIRCVSDAYEAFIEGSALKDLAEAWPRFDALAGKQVSAALGSTAVGGIAEGIDADGRLLVRSPSGELFRLTAGDVTLDK